ncbi:MAG: glycosyltransferase family 2 protein [Verrucomicrobia bacterium]|nr:glycosyltransferase family 2 protein [Verrucomicrobiota bacterium]
MRPLSILLPCYNEQQYIEQTILSLVEQDYQDFEVIISDNASTDSTVEKIQQIIEGDKRFKLIKQKQNIGAAHNWMFLIEKIETEFAMFLGGHDYLSPNFVGECLEAIQKNHNISISFGIPLAINEKGDIINFHKFKIYNLSDPSPSARYLSAAEYLNDATCVQGIMRSSLLKKFEFAPISSIDLILISYMLWHGNLHYHPETRYYRRIFEKRESSYMERITGQKNSIRDRYPFFQAYLKNFNSLFNGSEELRCQSLDELLRILTRRFGKQGLKPLGALSRFKMSFWPFKK